jgi:hypothetical protein
VRLFLNSIFLVAAELGRLRLDDWLFLSGQYILGISFSVPQVAAGK